MAPLSNVTRLLSVRAPCKTSRTVSFLPVLDLKQNPYSPLPLNRRHGLSSPRELLLSDGPLSRESPFSLPFVCEGAFFPAFPTLLSKNCRSPSGNPLDIWVFSFPEDVKKLFLIEIRSENESETIAPLFPRYELKLNIAESPR